MVELFWFSSFFVLYTYAIYPLAIMAIARWRHYNARAWKFKPVPVAVIIPAYNERDCIAAKIQNVLLSAYPPHLLRVVVVSDGSSDDTVEQARTITDPRVEVIAREHRGGKVAAINYAVSTVKEPVLILTDAQELFDRHAIGFLVEKLADPSVGAVSGELKFVDLHSGFSRNLGLYWRYETGIRNAESKFASMVGVTGAIYAIRRECFPNISADTILDDVAIPLEVVRQGHRVQFYPNACAFEHTTADVTQEFNRKRRTLAGNFQMLYRYRDLLNPFTSPVAWQLWSHKLFRLLVPYALVGVLVGSWFLPSPYNAAMVTLQLLFYGAALAAHFLRGRVRLPLVSLPYTFCMLNWAAFVSSYYYFAGLQSARWEKTK